MPDSTGPVPRQLGAAFGQRVRHYRTARGVTQSELAGLVGRSHQMVSGIEGGTRQIHVDELVVFADALSVPPAALLGSDDGDLFQEGYDKGYRAALTALRVHMLNLEADRDAGR